MDIKYFDVVPWDEYEKMKIELELCISEFKNFVLLSARRPSSALLGRSLATDPQSHPQLPYFAFRRNDLFWNFDGHFL